MIRACSYSQNDYAALVDIHNSLDIAWPEASRSPQAWAEADRNRSPRRDENINRYGSLENLLDRGVAVCIIHGTARCQSCSGRCSTCSLLRSSPRWYSGLRVF